jgi:hypothetical protein
MVDVSAVIISACALAVSINQANETEKVSSASVFPHIDMSIIGGEGSSKEKGIVLDNAGIGPAFIDDFNIYVDDKIIEGEKKDLWWNSFMSLGFTGVEANDFRYTYLTKSLVIKEGQRFYLIKPNLRDGKQRTLTDDEWEKLHRLSIRIDYHGAFGDNCHVSYSPGKVGNTIERTYCIKE